MPTRNISLTVEQDEFVEAIIEAGEYQNASEAVRDALRVLQQRRRDDALKLQAMRTQIKLGAAALDAGVATELEVEPLDSYLTSLTADHAKKLRRKPAC